MIAAVDASYEEKQPRTARVACVTFDSWTDPEPRGEHTTVVGDVADYAPGAFWRRELPCILAVLQLLPETPQIVVVDGYVWLDAAGRKGLGAHLFDALDGGFAVVGVAKAPFRGAEHATAVRHGKSERPLYVTAQGLGQAEAALAVASMHGEFRVPTLLKRVDGLCRRNDGGS